MQDQVASPDMLSAEQAAEIQQAFLVKVYGWMMAGLLLTSIFALLTIQTPALLELVFSNQIVFFGLIILQLGLVVWLSARVERMSPTTATAVFLGYSALTGLTLSVVFLAYTSESLASTFFVSAGTFGIMSAYGYLTKRDLSGLKSFLMMGLVGVILASIVNLFLGNSTVYWITTYIGILVFVGLTAYDTQRIKTMSMSPGDEEAAQKRAIIGALRLYLDFINLFLLLLRVMGSRR